MKRAVIFMGLIVCLAASAFAQEATRGVSTSTMDGARFEVIQSPQDNSLMFRLDKWTGTIDRLGTCPKDDGFWQQ